MEGSWCEVKGDDGFSFSRRLSLFFLGTWPWEEKKNLVG